MIDVGCLFGNSLQTGGFRNRFDHIELPETGSGAVLLDIMLPSMTAAQFGMLGEETAVVWLETIRNAIMVSLSEIASSRPDHKNDLDIVAIVGEDLVWRGSGIDRR